MNRDMLTQENTENVARMGKREEKTDSQRIAELEQTVKHLQESLAQQEYQNIGNFRLGPKPPWDDEKWIEEGNRLAAEICAVAERKLNMNCVRAKVRCNAKTANTVDFTTVYETDETKAADPENVRFTKATPWGDIRLGIDNPSAIAFFEVNKEYYVDFTVAAKPA